MSLSTAAVRNMAFSVATAAVVGVSLYNYFRSLKKKEEDYGGAHGGEGFDVAIGAAKVLDRSNRLLRKAETVIMRRTSRINKHTVSSSRPTT